MRPTPRVGRTSDPLPLELTLGPRRDLSLVLERCRDLSLTFGDALAAAMIGSGSHPALVLPSKD